MPNKNPINTKNIANIPGANNLINRINEANSSIKKCINIVEQINNGSYGGGECNPIEFTLQSHPDEISIPLDQLKDSIEALFVALATGKKNPAPVTNDARIASVVTAEIKITAEPDDDEDKEIANTEMLAIEQHVISEIDDDETEAEITPDEPVSKPAKKGKPDPKAVIEAADLICEYCETEDENDDCEDCHVTTLRQMAEIAQS